MFSKLGGRFLSGQSKLPSFLSPFQPFGIKAVWPRYDEVDQKYFWGFAGGCLRLQVEAAQVMKKLKCQYGVQSKDGVFWWTLKQHCCWGTPHPHAADKNNYCRLRLVCLLPLLLFCEGLVPLQIQPKAKDVLCCDWWNLNQTRLCK